MTNYLRFLFLIAALLCVGLLTSRALAFTANKNLAVSVIVPSPVKVLVSGMDFGATLGKSPVDSTSTITVNILAGQMYHISLDAGLYQAIERRMSDASGHFINYILYKDAARSVLWGDSDYAASYNSGSSLPATGTGNDQVFTVYGRLPIPATPIFAAVYHDTVTVTVHY